MVELSKNDDTPDLLKQPLDTERRQRLRSLVIALGLAFLVVLFYLATIVRLGGNALNRPL